MHHKSENIITPRVKCQKKKLNLIRSDKWLNICYSFIQEFLLPTGQQREKQEKNIQYVMRWVKIEIRKVFFLHFLCCIFLLRQDTNSCRKIRNSEPVAMIKLYPYLKLFLTKKASGRIFDMVLIFFINFFHL